MTRRVILLLVMTLLAVARLWAVPVQLLATGDMHGWLEAQQVGGQLVGGPAQMLAYWRAVEGYQPEKFLVISCGDVATGPALSTVFKGEPAVEVMNAMGYDLSVIGNHEFDFGRDALQKLVAQAKFPFLAANLLTAEGRQVPFAGKALLYTEQGVKIGIVGLTVQDLNALTNTGGLRVQGYAETLRAVVPALRAEGAQAIVVVAHEELPTLVALAKAVKELRIPLMLGGHSHEFGQTKVEGTSTWVVSSGQWWSGYSRIDLDVDPQRGWTTLRAAKQVWLQQPVEGAQAAPEVQAIVAAWRQRLPADDLQPIGYTVAGLTRPWGIGNFILDCWLAAHAADLAISNRGGFRQNLQPGPICKLDLTGVMPFDNSLLRLTLTGGQLAAYNAGKEALCFGGVRKERGGFVLLKSGNPLAPGGRYRVLINSFLYANSPQLKAADPNPETVETDWRAPVLAWLTAHATTREQPLERLVDLRPRGE